MEECMKVIGIKVDNMVEVNIHSKMEHLKLVNGKMEDVNDG